MLINYRTYTTLIATGLFDWLVRTGVIDLTNPIVTKETLEAAIVTAGLLLAALFRKYAGKPIPLLRKSTTKPEGGTP